MALALWKPHEAADYDAIMEEACTALSGRIQTDAPFRSALLHDPRNCHRDLFARFAPEGYSEYAGTYRGTPGTSLEHRPMHAPSVIDKGRFCAFAAPNLVPDRLVDLLGTIEREREEARGAGRYIQLLYLTHLLAWFGAIHPFLDGNGHIQRAMFAAAAAELGIPMSSRFAIHPRSYDRLLASQLEAFTRSNGAKEQLASVAEYLAFWLGGPFDCAGERNPR